MTGPRDVWKRVEQAADTVFTVDFPAIVDWGFKMSEADGWWTNRDAGAGGDGPRQRVGNAGFRETQRFLMRWLPQAERCGIPNATHGLQVMNPVAVGEAAHTFLKKHPMARCQLCADSVDYVVVGAGTAGCIVANRLSADPHVRVALLELGGMDTNPAIYEQRQHGLDVQPVGAGGGELGIHDCGAARTHGPDDRYRAGQSARRFERRQRNDLHSGESARFRQLEQAGNEGWSYDEVLPYFKKSETYHGARSAYHGENGPIDVIDYQRPRRSATHSLRRRQRSGHTEIQRLQRRRTRSGRGLLSVHPNTGWRPRHRGLGVCSPSLDRPNLRLLSRVRATRLVVENGRAGGVSYAGPDGQTNQAEREVVLCCGAFETPKLMMLSGLGPVEQLR